MNFERATKLQAYQFSEDTVSVWGAPQSVQKPEKSSGTWQILTGSVVRGYLFKGGSWVVLPINSVLTLASAHRDIPTHFLLTALSSVFLTVTTFSGGHSVLFKMYRLSSLRVQKIMWNNYLSSKH